MTRKHSDKRIEMEQGCQCKIGVLQIKAIYYIIFRAKVLPQGSELVELFKKL